MAERNTDGQRAPEKDIVLEDGRVLEAYHGGYGYVVGFLNTVLGTIEARTRRSGRSRDA